MIEHRDRHRIFFFCGGGGGGEGGGVIKFVEHILAIFYIGEKSGIGGGEKSQRTLSSSVYIPDMQLATLLQGLI